MDALPNGASCRLVCPTERFEKDKDGKMITVGEKSHYHEISSSYCISDAVDEKSHHLQSLFRREGEEGVRCWSCFQSILGKAYYFCSRCNEKYHKECVESPSLFQSSDHPKHPLQLVDFDGEGDLCCISCRKEASFQFYACFICDFIIHPVCARNPTSFTIDNPKRHEHTLHYIPRKSNMGCDVCGLEKVIDYLYACLQCDFIVHKQCVYLPYVIQVSRHSHRLTFTPSIPYKEWTNCGVCQTKINGNYGKYSCIKGCAYAVHTRCALRSDVCDGKELEGKPEEAYENTKMFEEEGDGIIRHLSHQNHQMQLDKMIESVYDGNKYCQMCILPFVDDGKVYRCLQCEFILHESCAYLPSKRQFMLHAHPLILKQYDTFFLCRKCDRFSCGFRYACHLGGCDWELDTLCASICEPFDHHSHPHPLFITCDEKTNKICSICREDQRQPLSCDKCDFVLCFSCATLPQKVRYEHDEHLLTFTYEEEDANDEVYSCEICEEDIYPKKSGFYACNECGVAFHIECLLGRDPYLKPGQSYKPGKIRILANNWSTRPECKRCKRRCPYKIKIKDYAAIFCSTYCLSN